MTLTQPLNGDALRALTPGAVFYEQDARTGSIFTVTLDANGDLHVTDDNGTRQPENEWSLDFVADMVDAHADAFPTPYYATRPQ